MLTIRCPHCGSKNVRTSAARGLWEHLREAVGLFPLRCKDCSRRFKGELWDLPNIAYARCHQCYNLELSSWTPDRYHLMKSWRVQLLFGARRRRCEACRKNFVSFLPAKSPKPVRTGA